MNVLNAEKRNERMKARQLRRTGFIPGCVYGKNIERSLHIQVPQHEAVQALRDKSGGSMITLNLEGKKLNVLIKEISRNPLSNQIENLQFQNLVSDEMVHGVMQIVLVNREKISSFIQQRLFEIHYKALPSHLVEKIEIDLEGMNVGSTVKVSDLDIAHNEHIELITDPDSLVLSIDPHKTAAAAPQETAEEAATVEE